MDLDEIYSAIGQCVYDSIDNDWEAAFASFCRNDNGTGYLECFYYSLVDGEVVPVDISSEALRLFELLHDMTGKNDAGVIQWRRATFALESTGDFSISFDGDV